MNADDAFIRRFNDPVNAQEPALSTHTTPLYLKYLARFPVTIWV